MAELRQNPATGEWAVIVPGRSGRPRDLHADRPDRAAPPAHDPDCPFCPGNEGETPPARLVFADAEGAWRLRVFANRYPILTAEPVPAASASAVSGPHPHAPAAAERGHDGPPAAGESAQGDTPRASARTHGAPRDGQPAASKPLAARTGSAVESSRGVDLAAPVSSPIADVLARPDVPEGELGWGLLRRAPAAGAHDVIVESPRHDLSLLAMDAAQLALVLRAYQARYAFYRRRAGIEAVVIFRNHGPGAGTSLAHPHSQLVALSFLPERYQRLSRRATAYHDRTGACLYQRIVADESRAGTRMLAESDRLAAFVPFAPRVPYEVWIVPKRSRTLEAVGSGELAETAGLLRNLLGALAETLADVSLNFIVLSPPTSDDPVRSFPWHIVIQPRTITRGGFELSTDIDAISTSPEDAAAQLRAAWPG